MRRRSVYKSLVYFLGLALLLLTNGIPWTVIEAREGNLPIGEMVSRGAVNFDVWENVWKGVEASHFPIFKGTKIKVGKGSAVINLVNNRQIEVAQHSLLSFGENDQIYLSEGSIGFRIPAATHMSFRVGALSIVSSRSLQASTSALMVSANDDEAIGAILYNSDKSVTVKSLQGKLSILDQDRSVLTQLPSKGSTTIPSRAVSGKEKWVAPQSGRASAKASLGQSSQGFNAVEQYLVDFSKRMKGMKLPSDLNARKYFSLLEPIYPDQKIIRTVRQYPVKVVKEGESYNLLLCDRDRRFTIIGDLGSTTDFVDKPYWRQEEDVTCPEDAVYLGDNPGNPASGAATAIPILLNEAMMWTLIVSSGDEEDRRPLCP